MKTSYRTALGGELGKADIGREVRLAGWADTRRNLGGVLFIDLRDRSGKIQLVVNDQSGEDTLKEAEKVRSEYVLEVEGQVVARSEETVNPNTPTGDIEVQVKSIKILDTAQTPPI